MAVGYPDLRDRKAGRRVKPRLPMREIVHSYDRALGEFVAAKVASFVQDGRERIRAVIEGQGLKLE
jgi:hypothetical protein